MLVKNILIGMIIFSALWLSGCGTRHYSRDGAPSFPVDASRIPDAVPRAEKLSRIGNKPSYTVRGTRYYVMKSRHNYSAVGIASWYGTKFHNHRTSNGEKYDMLAMSAAHRTLPLPTFLKVTNLENGKQVIVRVNDRGPFKQGRLIDLSYAAAKKIGMSGHGTALVEIKAIDPGYRPSKRISYNTKPTSHKHRKKAHYAL